MLKATHPESRKTIKTTEKMFRLIYAEQGYIMDGDNNSEEKTLEEYNLTELRALAKSRGFTNTSKMKAPELIALLAPSSGEDDNGEDEGGGDDDADNAGESSSGNENPA